MIALRWSAYAVALVSSVCAARAATLTSFVSKENKVIITLDGDIADGDADRLLTLVREANQAGRLVSGIRLNSPGGSLSEGAKLADAIRNGKIASVVRSNNTCASACFLAFAAGTEKFASYTAQVGVHGASDRSGEETTGAKAATVSMARIAKDLGVPERIIGKIVVTPPSQMVWLAPDELRSMGTTITGKPNQTGGSSGQGGNGAPVQLGAPAQQAAAPTQTAPLTWSSVLDVGISLSKEQNGGTARFNRTCQPEVRKCSNAVFFRGKSGEEIMLRSIEDENGKQLRRDICTFNQFGDIRTCSDFDTKAKTREMLNPKKEWVFIDSN